MRAGPFLSRAVFYTFSPPVGLTTPTAESYESAVPAIRFVLLMERQPTAGRSLIPGNIAAVRRGRIHT